MTTDQVSFVADVRPSRGQISKTKQDRPIITMEQD